MKWQRTGLGASQRCFKKTIFGLLIFFVGPSLVFETSCIRQVAFQGRRDRRPKHIIHLEPKVLYALNP